MLGNELLQEADPAYPTRDGDYFHLSAHTVERVFTALGAPMIALPSEFATVADANGLAAVRTSAELFTGYLLLDALIGNQDRHHENWGIIEGPERTELCPSFDHASSFAHNLGDDERNARMETSDKGYTIEAFVRKARSALFREAGDRRPLSPLDAFREAGQRSPTARTQWLGRLELVREADLADIVERVPPDRMSPVTKEFVLKFIGVNKRRLLALEV